MANEVALFIDLENIATSLWKSYQQTPDPRAWMDKALKYGAVTFARAYGDFRQEPLAALVPQMLAAGIDRLECPTKQRGEGTQSTVDSNIIIDLYEVALDRPNTDTFVLMAGDSDYIRVVTRLRNRFRKEVVVAGVEGSTSRELVRAANVEDPLAPVAAPDVDLGELVRIIDRFEATRREGVEPTFNALHRYLQDERNAPIIRPEVVQAKLNELIAEGLFEQYMAISSNGGEFRVTRLNRDHELVREALTS